MEYLNVALVILAAVAIVGAVTSNIAIAWFLVKLVREGREESTAFATQALEVVKAGSLEEKSKVDIQRDAERALNQIRARAIENDEARFLEEQKRQESKNFAKLDDGTLIDTRKYDIVGPGDLKSADKVTGKMVDEILGIA